MTDGDALLAAIEVHPGEDVPRLMYADWCDENGQSEKATETRLWVAERRIRVSPFDLKLRRAFLEQLEVLEGTVKCEKCKCTRCDGSGVRYGLGCWCVKGRMKGCESCSGTGRRSNGYAERVEFIRLQTTHIPACVYANPSWGPNNRHGQGTCPWCDSRRREEELISFGVKAGTRWAYVPALALAGRTSMIFRDGFLSGAQIHSRMFTRELAKELFGRFPITEVVLTDAEPWAALLAVGKFSWFPHEDYPTEGPDQGIIPDEIYEVMVPSWRSGTMRRDLTSSTHKTFQLALEELSRGAVDWGRSLADLPRLYFTKS